MPSKHVYIMVVNGSVVVNPDPVHVSISQGESAVWHCPQGTASITFKGDPKGSPFLSDDFDVPAGGSCGSGPPARGKVREHYKYSVTVTLPNDRRVYRVDPEVVVDNG